MQISGGSYENLAFLADENSATRSSRTKQREAIFAAFSSHAKAVAVKAANEQGGLMKAPPLIMCTGGFRSRNGIEHALREDGIDLIGIGRPAAADPEWLERMLDIPDGESYPKGKKDLQSCITYQVSGGMWLKKLIPLKLVGGGLATLWHELQMARIGRGKGTRADWSFERLLIVEFLQSSTVLSVSIAIFVIASAIYVAYHSY